VYPCLPCLHPYSQDIPISEAPSVAAKVCGRLGESVTWHQRSKEWARGFENSVRSQMLGGAWQERGSITPQARANKSD